MSDIMSYLFETKAIKFCEENKPFWYTSGKIGPYFINTHFVYGNETDANNLLSYIDECLAYKNTLPQKVFAKVLEQYNTNEIYRNVINSMKEYIENNIDLSDVDYISGGERRDWFFSNMIAYILNKPHITIYKDLTTIESNYDFTKNTAVSKIENKNFLHIADLLNQSASFTRAWIPAIENLGSKIKHALFVIDRMDGGTQVLTDCGVKVHSLIKINDDLFLKALDLNIINEKQLHILREFKKDQMASMKQFLIDHPEFLEESLKSDNPKTAKRAKMLVDQNLYGLN